MNEHLFVNNHGLRLITSFEGEPRLKARLCEGGAWELSYGVTFFPDGSPVKEGDTCTYDEALGMFRHALNVFEDHVKRLVTVPLNSNQFSALVSLCYNIGPENMERSSVLRHVNARRFDDAADAFGMWLYATLGQHKQAFRGLLRRRYAEAVVFMGYDFEVACSDDGVALVRERPPNDIGTDKVLFKTPFKDVLMVAQRYPLPVDGELILTTPAPSPRAADEAAQQPANPARNPAAGAAPAIEKSASVGPPLATAEEGVKSPPPTSPVGGVIVAKPAPPPRLPDPPVPIGQQREAIEAGTRQQDWSEGTKAMWQSRRFYGLVLIMVGRLWMLKTGSNAFLGAVSDPLVMEFVGGFGVMIAGELIQSWGRAKAKRALH